MEGFRYVDIYATKGIEYLIVLGFLGAFVFFVRFYSLGGAASAIGRRVSEVVEWFRVPDGYNFHQGHAWMKVDAARGDDGSLARVGLDDFAQKLVGHVEAVDLPPVGTKLTQGEKGWVLHAGSRAIPMLSPVDGEVVGVNEAAVENPGVVNDEPFEGGWLLKVRPARLNANRTNLLAGDVARKWTEEALHGLRATMGANLGPVYQDGGLPITGIARALYGAEWENKVKEYFLTEGLS